MCAGFCASPSIYTEKFFSETGISMLNTAVTAADVVQNSARFDPCGASGIEAGPLFAELKSCREKILSRRKAMKDTRNVGSVPKPLPHQLSLRLRPERVSASLISLRQGMSSMWWSMRSLVSLVVVGLRQVPERARRGERR